MKKIFVVLSASLLVLAGCQKDEIGPYTPVTTTHNISVSVSLPQISDDVVTVDLPSTMAMVCGTTSAEYYSLVSSGNLSVEGSTVTKNYPETWFSTSGAKSSASASDRAFSVTGVQDFSGADSGTYTNIYKMQVTGNSANLKVGDKIQATQAFVFKAPTGDTRNVNVTYNVTVTAAADYAAVTSSTFDLTSGIVIKVNMKPVSTAREFSCELPSSVYTLLKQYFGTDMLAYLIKSGTGKCYGLSYPAMTMGAEGLSHYYNKSGNVLTSSTGAAAKMDLVLASNLRDVTVSLTEMPGATSVGDSFACSKLLVAGTTKIPVIVICTVVKTL